MDGSMLATDQARPEKTMLDTLAPTTLGRVAVLVRDILSRHGVSAAVRPDDRLVDAGLGSMDMVNLMLAVEAEFDVMIPPADITPQNFRSVASITAMVDRVVG